MSERRIWARGLTPNENNRRVTVDGKDVILRSAEHYTERTVLTVLVAIEVPHDAEVIVHE